jgi:hypothetical protein
MNMKLYIPIRIYRIMCFYIFMFYQLPNYLTFWGLQKLFYLSHEFSNWGYYECNFFDETSIELSHSNEYLILFIYLCVHAFELLFGFS